MSASSFESLGLGYHLPEALAEMGIVQPTPIQVCCGRQGVFSLLSHTEAFVYVLCVCVLRYMDDTPDQSCACSS